MRNYRGVLVSVLLSCLIVMVGCSEREDARFDGQSAFGFAESQVVFGPRFPGSPGHQQAGEWIESHLENLGWVVEQQRFVHLGVSLTNYIARLPSQTENQPPVVLGAHYDTRPVADQDPLNPQQPVIGANDGASGVAVLIELARVLQLSPPDMPVWLVFFDGEDSGNWNGWQWIVGSTYFADHLEVVPQSVVIVDMIGDRDLQIYYDQNSDPDLSADIWGVADTLGYSEFVPEVRHAMIDDHTPFVQLGIPAIDIIDFDYPAWHTTEDTLEMISAQSLERVGRTLQAWLASLAVD